MDLFLNIISRAQEELAKNPQQEKLSGDTLRKADSKAFEIRNDEKRERVLSDFRDQVEISDELVEALEETQAFITKTDSRDKFSILREGIDYKLDPTLPKPNKNIFGDEASEIERLLSSGKLLTLASRAASASDSELITIKNEVRKLKNKIYDLGANIDLSNPKQAIALRGALDQLNAAESVIKLKEKEDREKVDGRITFYEVKASLSAAVSLELINKLPSGS